jgi:acetyl esterase/lipase
MPSQQMQDMIELLSMQPLFEVGDIGAMRESMETMLGSATLAAGAAVEPVRVAGRDAEWITMPNSAPDRVLLYLHGGGYVLGSPRTHRELATRIACEAAARVLLLDYRLAPPPSQAQGNGRQPRRGRHQHR